jgi:hypothetical protein
MFSKTKNNHKLPIFDIKYLIYNKENDYMKKEEGKKKRVSVTLDPKIIDMVDEKTSNRSNLINWLLKEHFDNLGEDVSKIKL